MAVARSSPIWKKRGRFKRDDETKDRTQKRGWRQEQGRQSHRVRKIKYGGERNKKDGEIPSGTDGQPERRETVSMRAGRRGEEGEKGGDAETEGPRD